MAATKRKQAIPAPDSHRVGMFRIAAREVAEEAFWAWPTLCGNAAGNILRTQTAAPFRRAIHQSRFASAATTATATPFRRAFASSTAAATASAAAPRRIIRYKDASSAAVHLALQPVENGPAARLDGDLFDPGTLRETGVVDDDVHAEQLLAPVSPPLVLGTGLNYRRHAEECGLPLPEWPMLAFVKPPGSVIGPHDAVEIPSPACKPDEPEVDWEVELAVVIGRHADGSGTPCKDVSPEEARAHVLGYTVANDVSARLWQTDPARTAGQWNKGKGFDTFCPLGPAIVLDEAGFDPHALALSLDVNGEQMQNSSTADFVFGVGEVVSFLSAGTTLAPGTVILTGTPEGIGMFRDPPRYLAHGDVVDARVEGIGTLTNRVDDLSRR